MRSPSMWHLPATARGGAPSDALIRLDDGSRILAREACERIVARVCALARGGGETRVRITSWWNGELRWARNRVSLAGDRRNIQVHVSRAVARSEGSATTNQLDDVSLEAVVRAAERASELREPMPPGAFVPDPVKFPIPETAIWSDATYGLTTESRGALARAAVEPAESRGVLSAGYLEVRAGTMMQVSSAGDASSWRRPYTRWTQAQCSTTVRDAKGSGSGWAGLSGYDWNAIDAQSLAERALQKAIASQSPVALEPGRYTVVLEPQAVADLVEILTYPATLSRDVAEVGRNAFALAPDDALHIWRTKLGLKVADERITISHDVADPQLGIIAGEGDGRVTWIERGVLTNLHYQRAYGLEKLNAESRVRTLAGYRMSGGETSVDEMIRTTRRGLLVTRFSNVSLLDPLSLLSTGLTRDGLWLIENGKISKAVKNFRFTESPLFVLNSIEQLGVPVPVFRPVKSPYEAELTPAIVPAIKSRDFSFTSTIDAI